jgi:hypothetical protein
VKAAPALALFALLLAACSDAFDPLVESDRAFALYGFLDARRDTQFVRVQSITGREEHASLTRARVTSTDLETGEATVWQDSLIGLDDGTVGTAFFAAFRPRPGRTYRVEAARPDAPDEAAEAVVRVPAKPALEVAVPSVLGESVTQRLTFEGAPPVERVVVSYTVRRVEERSEPRTFDVGYAPTSGRAADVLVSLQRDAEAIRSALGVDPEDPEAVDVALLALEVAYDVVVERQAEVGGGVGNFGAAAAFTDAWTLAPEFVDAIGFEDAQGDGRPGGAPRSAPRRP